MPAEFDVGKAKWLIKQMQNVVFELENLIKEGAVSYVYEPKGIYRRTRKPENLHVKRYFLRSVCDVIVGDSC